MDLGFFIGLFLLCFSFVLLLDLGLLNLVGLVMVSYFCLINLGYLAESLLCL